MGLPLHRGPRRGYSVRLCALGMTEASEAFRGWWSSAHRREPSWPLADQYGIDGRHEMPEDPIPLEGYRGSRPRCASATALASSGARHLWRAAGFRSTVRQVRFAAGVDAWAPPQVIDGFETTGCRPDDGIWEGARRPAAVIYSKGACGCTSDRADQAGDEAQSPAGSARLLADRDRIYEAVAEASAGTRRGRSSCGISAPERWRAAKPILPLVLLWNIADRPAHEGRSTAQWRRWCPKLGYRSGGQGRRDGTDGGRGTFHIYTFFFDGGRGADARGRLERRGSSSERLPCTYCEPLGLSARRDGAVGRGVGNFAGVTIWSAQCRVKSATVGWGRGEGPAEGGMFGRPVVYGSCDPPRARN